MSISPSAQELYDNDPSAARFGIELLAAADDGSQVQMTVTEEMVNGFQIGHGGITFLLADAAMAFASNGGGRKALAASASIDFLAPVPVGTSLIATAVRTAKLGRSSLWDIQVTDTEGQRYALVRGRTREVR